MNEKFLPIGSVVLLKDANKRLMVTGYYIVTEKEKDKIYDYSGCIFPEGMISSNQTFLFNHDQIIRIDHIGLVDEEQKKFGDKLKVMVEKVQNNNYEDFVSKGANNVENNSTVNFIDDIMNS